MQIYSKLLCVCWLLISWMWSFSLNSSETNSMEFLRDIVMFLILSWWSSIFKREYYLFIFIYLSMQILWFFLTQKAIIIICKNCRSNSILWMFRFSNVHSSIQLKRSQQFCKGLCGYAIYQRQVWKKNNRLKLSMPIFECVCVFFPGSR